LKQQFTTWLDADVRLPGHRNSIMDAVTLYNDIWTSSSELEACCKQSLSPRGADMLYDLFATFCPTAESEVIDIGCRDARYAIELASRFGCRVLGIDPAPIHIERAQKNIAEAGLSDRLRAELASIEALPAANESFDMIWCRDVLNHVDLQRGLAECARVLKPGGHMLVYQTFATPALEEREAARIYAAMAIVPQNMAESFFQATAQAAGMSITARDVVSSEWRERWAEEGSIALLEDLLAVARMRRSEAALIARYGREQYEATYASSLWGIYQMLGKLQPTIYLLAKA
jgi:SAM-dependent methyltransferase